MWTCADKRGVWTTEHHSSPDVLPKTLTVRFIQAQREVTRLHLWAAQSKDCSLPSVNSSTVASRHKNTDRKCRTHLLTSKGMLMFWRLTDISIGKTLQTSVSRKDLFNATGCSSVPGWRQLRTLCTSWLVERYFLFSMILLPSRGFQRFLVCNVCS